MLIALAAAGAMVLTDILGTIMVRAEAVGRGWLAGFMDAGGWIVSITTTSISVTVLTGHNLSDKAWVIGLVSIANVLGTKCGTDIGTWLLRKFPTDGTTRLAEIAPGDSGHLASFLIPHAARRRRKRSRS